MALPADFSKIYGSTATGGLTPIGDVNYAKGWEFVGANPPTKNDFSYLQNLSDLKSKWLYSNKLQRTNPFGDIKSDGEAAISTALANLGLTDIGIGADTPGADKPLLTGAKSSGFYIYGGGSDADFGPDFGVVITILYDAVSDIRVQMYIPLTNSSGTSPIIRGIHSGATTWKYKLYSENNKPSLSELGLSAGSPPIGIPFFWPSSAMPNTVMPEWSEMVFLKMNDATFSANTYPLLAKVWPSLKLNDCRGEFIRIADDGRGVDAGRNVLSAQGDTIQNITGEVGIIQYVGPTHAGGALYAGGAQWKTVTTDGGATVAQSVFFDASRSVRTSNETRPRNIAFNLLVRAK